MTVSKDIIRPWCIGMTGGIACGKSTVADLFAKLGIDIVDADLIARQAVAKGSLALDAIAEHFGPDILNADGTLDRRKLRNIVFSDDSKLLVLNSIVHPYVHKMLIEQINSKHSLYVIAVIPLLFEHKLNALFDRILVVDCSEQLQIQRICTRDGSGEDIAQNILKRQVSRDIRLSLADDIISTEDISADELYSKVQKLDLLYRELALSQHK